MKKIKLIFVVTLSVLLTFMCFVNSTFSWFDRPMEKKGSSFKWSENHYPVSTGKNVSIKTYTSGDDGVTYGETPITSMNNDTIAPGDKKCFRTDITNPSGVNQSVSLFLSGLKSNQNFSTYIGVNNPMRTHKPIASDSESAYAVISDVYKRNVYMGLHSGERTGDKALDKKEPNIHYWNDEGLNNLSSDGKLSGSVWANRIATTSGNGKWRLGSSYWTNNEQEFNIFAMTIDSRATYMQLNYKDNQWSSEVDISEGKVNNTLVFFEWNNGYFVQDKESGAGAQIDTFYSSAQVDKGKTVSIPATGKGTISYSSNNTAVATVGSTTGLVTGVKAGTATITAKSTGAYGDTITSTCTVTVRDAASAAGTIDNVPIVTNLLVDKTIDEAKPSVVSVYWYIRNESYNNITYSFDKISLTL